MDRKIRGILEELNILKEDFETGYDSIHGGYSEIFSNPSRKELADIAEVEYGGDVRFIADRDKKKVYIAKASVLHMDIVDKTSVGDGSRRTVYNNFSGVGYIEGGKVIVTSLANIFQRPSNSNELKAICYEIANGEYDWMRKYNFDLREIIKWSNDKLEEMTVDWEQHLKDTGKW